MPFAGDKKFGRSILHTPEQKLVAWGTPKIPRFVETYHLTLLTIVWSALNPLFGYLAKNYNLHWLWMVSGMIFLQYVTDLYDGAIGRSRNTGLVKWGFYMDHFLDYVFFGSLVVTGYIIAPPGLGIYFMALFLVTVGFMVSSFLSFAATNQFQIAQLGIGPTEMRIVFIVINTVIIITGTSHFRISVPIVCGICAIGLVVTVFRTSRNIWALDMKNKDQSEAKQ